MCPFAIEVPTTALELFSVASAALVEASALFPAALAAFILAAAASWLALAETEAGSRASTVAWKVVRMSYLLLTTKQRGTYVTEVTGETVHISHLYHSVELELLMRTSRTVLTMVATLAQRVFFLNHGLSLLPSSSAAAGPEWTGSGTVEER